MRVSVCLGAILIPEYLGSRIAGIYSGIYSYSGISLTNAPLIILENQIGLQLLKRMFSALLRIIIIWLAPRAGKMNQILRCDWLPERARWSHLARSGLPVLSRKKNFPKTHIINPLLTKLVRSRWLDIGLVLFLRVYGPRLRLGP